MLTPPLYEPSHTTQLRLLYQKGHHQQLTLAPQHTLFYPSLLKHKFYQQIQQKLNNKKHHTPQQLCYLIISLTMTGGNYLLYKAKLKEKYGDKWIGIIDKWLQNQQQQDSINKNKTAQSKSPQTQQQNPIITHITKHINTQLHQMRTHFQHLNQKATNYQYFKLKQVPVYLISTKWLQRFYDNTLQQPLGPIDNRHLIKMCKYVDTDKKLVHFNYQLKQQMKQNTDYKIVSPDCWQFLYQRFNGVQIKRFTTSQKQPTVEIHYRKLLITVVQNRYIHASNIELSCSRFTTFKHVIQRLKRLIIAYKIVPFTSLTTKVMQIIKVDGLNEGQLIDIIQDDQIQEIDQIMCDDNFYRLGEELDVQQAKIYSHQQLIVVNLIVGNNDHQEGENNYQPNLFTNVKQLQTVIIRQSCLKCGSYNDVYLCICKSVHFCSVSCQQTHKQHTKQCQKIRKEQMQINKLIKDYDITQRQFQLTQEMVLKYGKVGLQNLRNTCYLNSAIQCILRVDKLVKYFANNSHLSDLNVDNVLGSEGHLACSFGQLVKKYYNTNKRSISPIDVIRIIAKNPQFRGAQHQDSQQFLNYFLDKLHQDLNRIKRKPYVETIQSDGRPDAQVSKQSWDNYLKRNSSFVQQLFAGQYRSQIRCPDCERISITFDPFMSVTLQFPKVQQSLFIKGYLLTTNGQFLKLQSSIPPTTTTRQFLTKTFLQTVQAATIKNKVIKKIWREQLTMTKNHSDDGLLLFYIKEQGWQVKIDLQFIDEKKQLIGFNRRIYIKNPQNIEQLQKDIYKHLRVPLQKAFENKFETQQEYLAYCNENQIVVFYQPKQTQLQFPLSNQPLTLRLQFNEKFNFVQKPKLNLAVNSYQPASEFAKSKDFSTHGLSIHDMLQNFCRPQRLTQDNMWYCSKCKDHKMADKIMKLYKLPEILIMHLKRFNHKNTKYRNLIGVQKIEISVKLPEYEIINGIKYELIGVVNHFGSMTFGHYTAYVKKDQWMKYDDQSVKRCNVNGDSAYLVFYKRCE